MKHILSCLSLAFTVLVSSTSVCGAAQTVSAADGALMGRGGSQGVENEQVEIKHGKQKRVLKRMIRMGNFFSGTKSPGGDDDGLDIILVVLFSLGILFCLTAIVVLIGLIGQGIIVFNYLLALLCIGLAAGMIGLAFGIFNTLRRLRNSAATESRKHKAPSKRMDN